MDAQILCFCKNTHFCAFDESFSTFFLRQRHFSAFVPQFRIFFRLEFKPYAVCFVKQSNYRTYTNLLIIFLIGDY